MLRVRSFQPCRGLGAVNPDAKLYQQPSGECPNYACAIWSFNDLVARGQVQQVVVPGNKYATFYPTPQHAHDAPGGRTRCQALRVWFEGSNEILWRDGVTKIEAGTYYPTRSWDEIIADSNAVRNRSDLLDGSWVVRPVPKEVSVQSVNPMLFIAAGSTFRCTTLKTYGGSEWCGGEFCWPSNSSAVLATASRWIFDNVTQPGDADKILAARSRGGDTYDLIQFEGGQRTDWTWSVNTGLQPAGGGDAGTLPGFEPKGGGVKFAPWMADGGAQPSNGTQPSGGYTKEQLDKYYQDLAEWQTQQAAATAEWQRQVTDAEAAEVERVRQWQVQQQAAETAQAQAVTEWQRQRDQEDAAQAQQVAAQAKTMEELRAEVEKPFYKRPEVIVGGIALVLLAYGVMKKKA